MNGSRRSLLVASGSLAAALAGCLGEYAGGGPPAAADRETAESPPTERTTTPPPTDSADYPATVNATATVEREEIEYVAGNDTVRYVAAYRHSNPDEVANGSKPEREPVYEHVPFEEWADVECASVGSARVMEAMDERPDGETEGVSAGVTHRDDELKILVAH